MKYAIIQSGGKQYRIEEGQTIDIELLDEETNASFKFEEVLFVHDGKKAYIGTPYVKEFVVQGKVLEDTAGPKVRGAKYNPRGHDKHQWGHRQKYTRVECVGIKKARAKKEEASSGT